MIDQRALQAVVRPGIGPESFWKPAVMVDSAWHEHAPFASWLVAQVRPRSIVELGTHNGFSFFVFCEALARCGIDASAVAVDTWRGDEHAGFYGEEIFAAVAEIRQARYPTAELYRGYFDEAALVVEDGSVDLLHIDGRHGYEDVLHDFETWLPKLSDRGVVLFHDTAEHIEGFGVWRFWDEVQKRYPSFGFTHGHGLGVLAVGEHVSPALLDLMASDSETLDTVRRTYEALGRDISRSHDEQRQWEGRLDELRTRIAELESVENGLRDRVELLVREREEILSSTSWKVTAPLRAVGSVRHRRTAR